MECEDLLDEEVRKELIALADEELCSLEENPYSSHAPFSECYRPKDIVCCLCVHYMYTESFFMCVCVCDR